MKKKKMNLTALKVKSFTTDLGKEKELTVKGGGKGSFILCRSINACSLGDCGSVVSACLCPATNNACGPKSMDAKCRVCTVGGDPCDVRLD